jgi:hypothetical protein
MKDYGAITEPLTQLLWKTEFQWSNEADATFHKLRHALTTAPVLQLPDFDRDFVVECGASRSGVGTMLHQGGGPIAFFSSQIAPCHSKLAAYERELIGLVQAVRHWRRYLWGKAFIIKTDHFSLKYLLDQRLATILQHQWVSKLMGFDLYVEYKSGASNTVANELSHRDAGEDSQLAAILALSFKVLHDLRTKTEEVTSLQQLKDEVRLAGPVISGSW